jgi:hypothetical protein
VDERDNKMILIWGQNMGGVDMRGFSKLGYKRGALNSLKVIVTKIYNIYKLAIRLHYAPTTPNRISRCVNISSLASERSRELCVNSAESCFGPNLALDTFTRT